MSACFGLTAEVAYPQIRCLCEGTFALPLPALPSMEVKADVPRWSHEFLRADIAARHRAGR